MTISVRYAVGDEVRTSELSTFCPLCVREFVPDVREQQADIGAPVEVHCSACGALALRWLAPVPVVGSGE